MNLKKLSKKELIEKLLEAEKNIDVILEKWEEPKLIEPENPLENRINNLEEVVQEFDKKLSKLRWDLLCRDAEIEKLRNRNVWGRIVNK